MSKKAKDKANKRSRSCKRCGTVLHLLVILSIALSSWVLWTDHELLQRFTGAKWLLPAQVYARSLDLYDGKHISSTQLTYELQALGYRRVAQAVKQGEYSISSGHVQIITRGFTFWDGVEPSRRIDMHLDHNGIVGIAAYPSMQGSHVVRLEPLLIAKIYPQHQEDRMVIRLQDAPNALIDTLLLTEDRDFFKHSGIDASAIIRAAITNLMSGKLTQGGSTLTQQLVKNLYLTQERSFARKVNEIVMALLLERRFGKEDILAAYLNEVYLGQDGNRAIHGFAMGARFYFGAPLNELRFDQIALLVALVKGPSYYNPRRHPERALQRRNVVIRQLQVQGAADVAWVERQMQMPLDVIPKSDVQLSRYPAFMDLVRSRLLQDYNKQDLQVRGLRIFTTLDPYLQNVSEEALSRGIQRLEKRTGAGDRLQGAVVATRKDTGEVLALVGGRQSTFAGFNRAINARRQVGSLLKPMIYLAAISQPRRYHLFSELSDAPIALRDQGGKIWRPRNYNDRHQGNVYIMDALTSSNNTATVRLGLDIGVSRASAFLHVLGLRKQLPDYPSWMLGAIELTPYEVTELYETLASGGFRVPPRVIEAVTTEENMPLQRYPIESKQVIEPGSAYLINYALTKVVEEGTAKALRSAIPSHLPVAGKTGTTNDLRDSWFAGFNEHMLAVVWLGRDDNQSIKLTGSNGAMLIWSEIIKRTPPYPLVLSPPDTIGWRWFDKGRGTLTDAGCATAGRFPFHVQTPGQSYAPCVQ